MLLKSKIKIHVFIKPYYARKESCIVFKDELPMVTSGEQQVAIKLQEFGLPECKALRGESPIHEAPRASAKECLLQLLCLYMFAIAIFVWYLA